MGCDGGTIPKRDELIRTKQKGEQKDKNCELSAKWQYCAISSNKLVQPIVSCSLGRLYNKVSVIEYLLDKESVPNASICQHIRNIKDVIELNLTLNNNYSDKKPEIDGQYMDTNNSQYVCPVVGLEMNGKYKFCYIRKCGCVLSERALKEVKSETCHKCNEEFSTDDDVIVLNGNDEEVESLRQRMNERRVKDKELKKNRKRKALEIEVKEDSKSGKTDPSHSLFTASTSKRNTKNSSSSLLTDKASKEYSVAKDPNASEVYKSIFTSHKTAQNKPKAHWVTFNPCYY